MAITKSLAQRLFKISRMSHQALTSCRISSTAAVDPGDQSFLRRLLLPVERKTVMQQLKGMDIVRNRIRLEGLSPPAEREVEEGKLTVAEARKVLRVTQLEMVKERIRGVGRSCVSYEEFVEICVSGCGGSRDLGFEFAKTLDQCGTVIVLGSLVFLRPDQVVKAVRGLMPTPVVHPEDPRRKELDEMEQQKFMIDQKAESMVRRELWCGLGYLVIQTAGFMRLTFWELSWDVMEPICFYVTSMYFMAGYAFFLRTAKEPSFEGFFQSRYETKQKKLMKLHNFDLSRYNELREACYPHPWPREMTFSFAPMDDETNASLGEYN